MRIRSLPVLVLLVIGASLLIAGCVQSQPAANNTTPAQVQTTLQTNGTAQEALVSFVDTAAAYAKTNGREKALAAFSNRSGPFVKGDLYIFAYDFNGTNLALPFQPELVGVNRLNVTDAQGVFFVREQRDIARNGTGFVTYSYPNPAHDYSVESKLGYVEKVDDTWWLGSGIYTGPAVTATTNTTPVQGNASSQEALVSFVDTALSYAQAHDRDKVLAAFSNPNGSFAKGDLYIFAYDFNGTTLALPFQPELVGVNRLNATDSQGEFFIRNLRDTARNGTGFVRYTYPNPAHSNAVESKLSYVEKVDDSWFLGSGIYTGPAVTATTSGQGASK